MTALDKPRADKRPWPPHNKTVAQVWAEESVRAWLNIPAMQPATRPGQRNGCEQHGEAM